MRHKPEEGAHLITIPLIREAEVLRLKTESDSVLPPEFFTGKSDFETGSRVASAGTTGGGSGAATGGWIGSIGNETSGPSGETIGSTGGSVVHESDAWAIAGQKLYYYNLHRGLHKIDISNLAAPRLETTYELNATCDRIFALTNDIVLMIMLDCWPSPSLVAIDMKSQPRILWEHPLPGVMYEARLAGADFILAAPTHRESDTPGFFDYGTSVLCLDLSDPSTNRVKADVFLPLWGIVSKATDRYLFLAGSYDFRWSVEPNRIDLRFGSSAPEVPLPPVSIEFDGLTRTFRIDPANGSIPFLPESGTFEWNGPGLKLVSSTGITNVLQFSHPSNYSFYGHASSSEGLIHSYFGSSVDHGGVPEWQLPLTALSIESLRSGNPRPIELESIGHPKTKSNFHEENGILTTISEGWRASPGGGGMTWSFIETFSLAANPVSLGFADFAPGEELFTVRFDTNRAYAVTSSTNDGVWLLDLANPRAPQSAGRLPLPGRTLFVQPLSNSRVLTVGLGHAPALGVTASLFDVSNLQAPALLDRKSFESAPPEAWEIRNDKAFAAYLPEPNLALIPIWDRERRRQIQLIDVNETNLTIRGSIDGSVEPRRITAFGDTLLSVSALEIFSATITNRDQPLVQGRVNLMRQIDEVFEFGADLVEIDYGNNNRPPEVRLAKDGTVTQRLVLPNSPVVRFERRGNLLFFAQSRVVDSQEVSETNGFMHLSIVELASDLRLLGETEFAGPVFTWQEKHDLLWPSDGALVWCVNAPRPEPPAPPFFGGVAGGSSRGDWWEGNVGVAVSTPPHGGLLGAPVWFILNVSDPSAPKFLSRTSIDPREKTNFSETFVGADSLYVSYLWQKTKPRADGALDVEEGTELAVVDLSTLSEPVVRAPITVPANLVAITANGGLLYTAGFDFLTNGQLSTNIFLTVLAYDGVDVYLADRTVISHLSSAFIKEREGSIYFLENRLVESSLLKFHVGRVPILRKEAEISLGANRLARLWKFGDGFAYGNRREIRTVSLTDRKVSRPLDISALLHCRWWFNAEHLAQSSAGYLMPLGYYNPQIVPLADSP